jgi:hypothetical protein
VTAAEERGARHIGALIASGDACLWAHGHTHDSRRYRDAFGCLVICNPAGYVLRSGLREKPDFQPRLVLDLTRTAAGGWRAARARTASTVPG